MDDFKKLVEKYGASIALNRFEQSAQLKDQIFKELEKLGKKLNEKDLVIDSLQKALQRELQR